MTTPNDTKAPRVAFWLRAMETNKRRLTHEYRRSLRDEATKGISDEDLATTERTLEQMARNLGWDESQQDEHHEHGFGPGHGFGHEHGFGPGGFRSGREFRRALRKQAMMHGFGHRAHHDHPETGAPEAKPEA